MDWKRRERDENGKIIIEKCSKRDEILLAIDIDRVSSRANILINGRCTTLAFICVKI